MTTIKKTILATAGAVSAFVTSTASAFAAPANQIEIGLPKTSQFNVVSDWDAGRIIRAGVNLVLVGAAIIAFFFLLIGGFQWIMAGGDKDGTEKAKKRITASLIGLVIVFSAYAIITLASSFLGVPLLSMNIQSI